MHVKTTEPRAMEYLDSMGGSDCGAFDNMERWVADETNDKGGEEVNTPWTKDRPDIPPQLNGHDCGVFMLAYMEALRDSGCSLAAECSFDFDQSDIEEKRKKAKSMIMRHGIDRKDVQTEPGLGEAVKSRKSSRKKNAAE